MSETRAGEKAGTWAFSAMPHLVHPSRDVACWLTDPPGAVIQITRPAEGTRNMTSWMAKDAHELLLARFPAVHDLTIILDLSLMTGRDAGARNALVEPAKRLKSRVARTILLPPRSASRVYLGSLFAATAVLSAFGIHVQIENSLPSVLAKYGLRAAAP
jgi:hypothetical protein